MSIRSLRRGSVAASRASAPVGGNVLYLSLPGTSGNYAHTPDSAANSIAGDQDVRIDLQMADYTPGANMTLVGKWGSFGQFSWTFVFTGSDTLRLNLSSDGSNISSTLESSAPGLTDGVRTWLRFTRVQSSGATTFYKSTDGSSWTTISSGTTTAGLSIKDSTSPVEIGSRLLGTQWHLLAQVYKVEIRNGIDGPVVNTFDPTTVTKTATRTPTSVVAPTGETWTVDGSAWDWVTV